MEKIELNELTPAQRAELLRELETQKKAEQESVRLEREEYKQMVDDAVRESFRPLADLAENIADVKRLVFNNFETLIALKRELYGVRGDQLSHTFTTKDGKVSIKLGHRANESFDDTLSAGIDKVKAYLSTLARDPESSALVETILELLRMDAKGNLKASRVLELRKLANRVQNADFSDGIRIIEESYHPARSCRFIEVKFKDEHGKEHALPLSVSAYDV